MIFDLKQLRNDAKKAYDNRNQMAQRMLGSQPWVTQRQLVNGRTRSVGCLYVAHGARYRVMWRIDGFRSNEEAIRRIFK